MDVSAALRIMEFDNDICLYNIRDIEKRYKKLALKYHPDKLSLEQNYLPPQPETNFNLFLLSFVLTFLIPEPLIINNTSFVQSLCEENITIFVGF